MTMFLPVTDARDLEVSASARERDNARKRAASTTDPFGSYDEGGNPITPSAYDPTSIGGGGDSLVDTGPVGPQGPFDLGTPAAKPWWQGPQTIEAARQQAGAAFDANGGQTNDNGYPSLPFGIDSERLNRDVQNFPATFPGMVRALGDTRPDISRIQRLSHLANPVGALYETVQDPFALYHGLTEPVLTGNRLVESAAVPLNFIPVGAEGSVAARVGRNLVGSVFGQQLAHAADVYGTYRGKGLDEAPGVVRTGVQLAAGAAGYGAGAGLFDATRRGAGALNALDDARALSEAAGPTETTTPGRLRLQALPDRPGTYRPSTFTQSGGAEIPPEPTLPPGLSGARPRYRQNAVVFESDLDKAAYIVSAPSQSKQHDAYMKFLQDAGETPQSIRARYDSARNALRSGQPDDLGRLVVPPSATPPTNAGAFDRLGLPEPGAAALPDAAAPDALLAKLESGATLTPAEEQAARDFIAKVGVVDPNAPLHATIDSIHASGTPVPVSIRQTAAKMADGVAVTPGESVAAKQFVAQHIETSVSPNGIQNVESVSGGLQPDLARTNLIRARRGLPPLEAPPAAWQTITDTSGTQVTTNITPTVETKIAQLTEKVKREGMTPENRAAWGELTAEAFPENATPAWEQPPPPVTPGGVGERIGQAITGERPRGARPNLDLEAPTGRIGAPKGRSLPPPAVRPAAPVTPPGEPTPISSARRPLPPPLRSTPAEPPLPNLLPDTAPPAATPPVTPPGPGGPSLPPPPPRVPPTATGATPPGGTPPVPPGKTPPPPSLWSQIGAFPMSAKSTLDLSAPGRQLAPMLYAHPTAIPSVMRAQFRALRSADAFAASQEALRNAPDLELMKAAGVDLGGIGNLAHEEQIASADLLGKIPVLGKGAVRSNDAYTAAINEGRAWLFRNMTSGVDDATLTAALEAHKNGTTNEALKEVQRIGRLVNASTGRGNLGKVLSENKIAGQPVFWAPRLFVGRVQLPLSAFTSASPTVRKEAARQTIAFVGGNVALLAFAKATLGDKVDVQLDPRSADFGELRIGQRRYDPWAGYKPMANLVARLAYGAAGQPNMRGVANPDGSTRIYTKDNLQVVSDFLRAKLAPVAGEVVNQKIGRDLGGQKVTEPIGGKGGPAVGRIEHAAIALAAPLFLESLAQELGVLVPEGAQRGGFGGGAAAAATTIAANVPYALGAGGGYYDDRPSGGGGGLPKLPTLPRLPALPRAR